MIRLWVTFLLAGGAPATTVQLRRYYVGRLSDAHPDLLAVTVDDLAAWLGSQTWAPNTMKSARSALRSFYGWARATGRREDSPAELLPPVRVPRARPRPTPEVAYRSALAIADEREQLALMLGAQCGLRRGEIARVRGRDLEPDLSGWSLRVVGKGGHVRLVPVTADVAARIRRRGEDWTFPTPRGGHLTPHHLAKLVSALLPDGVTTHSLRHRCATTAYAATRDLRAVQDLLGHSKPETTAGYVLTPQGAVRAAVEAAAA
ncbi:tyrosine-type recombinase/integrase [Luteipulveratus sp. YIM 133132]|uniref:tyrosine-type recombinase/integrase n=1 Tax=Luteipulveratus flavus TaxID=3031728 RepID=UPI0023B03D77|nr:tyrosine-type recombinase/integrase [Luteipulveratus sp. YIM 133132]MDE9365485.1 tyrosine-type recombinase/integrase [Luteipulveratus sp. YIM 133132]